jgi:hypothetical protein
MGFVPAGVAGFVATGFAATAEVTGLEVTGFVAIAETAGFWAGGADADLSKLRINSCASLPPTAPISPYFSVPWGQSRCSRVVGNCVATTG